MSPKPRVTEAEKLRILKSVVGLMRNRRFDQARRMRKSLWRRLGIREYQIPDAELQSLLAKLPVK